MHKSEGFGNRIIHYCLCVVVVRKGENMMNKDTVSVLADICIIFLFVLLLIWLFFGKLFAIILPFLIAYLIALLLRRPVRFVTEKTKIPAGIVSTAFVIGTVSLVCFGVWAGANRLLAELGDLIASLGDESAQFGTNVDKIVTAFDSVTSRIPALRDSGEGLRRVCSAVDEFVKNTVNEFVSKLSDDMGMFVAETLKRLPETFLYILVTVIASVYISASLEKVNSFFVSLIPQRYRGRVRNIGTDAAKTARQYFRAYSLIYLITFGELFLGLSLIGVRYSFFFAIIIAFVDILPVFGVGTVLVPWAIVSFLLDDSRMFTSLVILYAVITIVRQVAEPKIVGHSLGLNPLLTLLAMFAGYRLVGVLGMILFPALAVILFGIFSNGRNGEKKELEKTEGY